MRDLINEQIHFHLDSLLIKDPDGKTKLLFNLFSGCEIRINRKIK